MAKDLSIDLELHQRLMDGDPTALSRVMARFATPVLAWASRKYPRVPVDEIWTLLDDVFLNLHAHPEKYHPQKMRLHSYLMMALNGDLANHTRKTQSASPNDRTRQVDVELFPNLGNHGREPVHLRQMEQREILACVYRTLKQIIPEEPAYTVASMVIEGIREREKYASVLGISEEQPEVIKQQVDRFKDKIKQKLRRKGWPGIIQKCKQS